MDENTGEAACELCGRMRALTFHHLIPRTVHSNRWFKKRFTREQMNSGILICRACHHYLHQHFDHKQLARDLNTLDALHANEKIRTYLDWARNHP
jgi:hypothetical protein